FRYAPSDTEYHTLCLHDALPISFPIPRSGILDEGTERNRSNSLRGNLTYDNTLGKHEINVMLGWEMRDRTMRSGRQRFYGYDERSEEHTSELQSRENLVCRLLLE